MSSSAEKMHQLKARQRAPIATHTDLDAAATKDIAAVMNGMLADAFALYLKTKNFHWHMSGPHFRDYHLLLMSRLTRFLRCRPDRRTYSKGRRVDTQIDRSCRANAVPAGQ